jgi:hypothetical protein
VRAARARKRAARKKAKATKRAARKKTKAKKWAARVRAAQARKDVQESSIIHLFAVRKILILVIIFVNNLLLIFFFFYFVGIQECFCSCRHRSFG